MFVTINKPTHQNFRYRVMHSPQGACLPTKESQPDAEQTESFVPRVNVSSNDAGYVLTTELPGMNKDDVHISFTEKTLTISGERKRPEDESVKWIHRERKMGTFERRIRIEKQVDSSGISGTFENGVLEIQLPFSQELKAKEIKIQ